MVLVWTPSPPPHAKACVSRNCDTNARIKFIFDTAIDDLEWKNPIHFGDNRKNQNGRGGHFVKYDEKVCALHNLIDIGHNQDLKWPPAAILKNKCKKGIDLKWREMRSKVIFGHPK